MFKETPSLDSLGIKYIRRLLFARSVARAGLSGLGLRTKSAPCSRPAGLLESQFRQHRQHVLRFAAD